MRSLLQGKVVHISMIQDGPKLSVVVYVQPPTTTSPTATARGP